MSAGGIVSLRMDLLTLGNSLALWGMRDDTKAQPEVRRAANTAMDAIDRMLAELHATRAALVTGIRQSDDAAMARSEALLAEPAAVAHYSPGCAEGHPHAPDCTDPACNCACHEPEDQAAEPEPAEYDPGPEVEGGMSEYRYALPEDYLRGGAW